MSEKEKNVKESTKLETLIELLYTDRLSQYGKRELVNYIERQQKEIEEKSTILMAGAEKVKELEKGNRSLMESRIKWKNRYYKEKAKNKEYISKDKIRKYLNSLKYWEDNNTNFLESKGEIFLNKEFIVNILEDLLKE